MKIISFTHTFGLVQSYADAYNKQYIFTNTKGKKQFQLTCCLRSSHIALFQEIIRCYAAQLYKFTPLPEQPLPPFSTNNHILANRLGVSSRSVQRYLSKLQESGLVLHKIFKGSRSTFDLYLNQDVLCTYPQAHFKPVSSEPTSTENNIDNQTFTPQTTTSCPHKDTSSFTNSVIKDVDSGKLTEDTPCSSLPACLTQPGNTGTGNTGQEMGLGQPAAIENSAAPARLAQLDEWVDRLFSLMQHTLFHRLPYLSYAQIHKGKQFLKTYFNEYTPQNYQQCYSHLQHRVILAQKYISGKPGRFVPLPAVYLNPANLHGFSNTKYWYHQALLSQAKTEAIQNAQHQHSRLWNVFCQSIQTYQHNPSIHQYQLTKNKLTSIHPPLAQAFDSYINDSLSIK